MTEPFSLPVRVRYVECDMQGRVFNAHYLTWFDMAHTDALHQVTGLSYAELLRTHGIDFVVAESNVRYRAPAHYDDRLDVVVAFDPPTTSSLTSRFTVVRDGTTLTEGMLRHVCVDAAAFTKAPWPDPVREALAGYAAGVSSERPSRPT
ncbi:acyl-CoA thioesterase [Baekduia soli]|uniref:acyl-CoA thioesterase n=1 Tax=Baekduia soli TaxID=496014 RepID=UPI001E45C245|nr:thioesterase family protein [Baekduia soli]